MQWAWYTIFVPCLKIAISLVKRKKIVSLWGLCRRSLIIMKTWLIWIMILIRFLFHQFIISCKRNSFKRSFRILCSISSSKSWLWRRVKRKLGKKVMNKFSKCFKKIVRIFKSHTLNFQREWERWLKTTQQWYRTGKKCLQ